MKLIGALSFALLAPAAARALTPPEAVHALLLQVREKGEWIENAPRPSYFELRVASPTAGGRTELIAEVYGMLERSGFRPTTIGVREDGWTTRPDGDEEGELWTFRLDIAGQVDYTRRTRMVRTGGRNIKSHETLEFTPDEARRKLAAILEAWSEMK